MSLACVDSREQ